MTDPLSKELELCVHCGYPSLNHPRIGCDAVPAPRTSNERLDRAITDLRRFVRWHEPNGGYAPGRPNSRSEMVENVELLVAQCDRLRAAMERYGLHDPGCPSYAGGKDRRCTCGLKEALAVTADGPAERQPVPGGSGLEQSPSGRGDGRGDSGITPAGAGGRRAPGTPIFTDEQIKHMVSRFLGWRLPENFQPDAGISFQPEYNSDYNADRGLPPSRHQPIGTNLFNATEAEAMVRYMVEGMPAHGIDANITDDAARYRWLRSNGFSVPDPRDDGAEWTFEANEGLPIDQAIDAWRSGGNPGGSSVETGG